MVGLLKFNIVILLLLMTLLLLMYRNRVKQIEACKELISNQEKIIQLYKSAYDTLKSYGYGGQTCKNSQYDNDIKEAVKYAMKKSHPDNGGSNEDFNKFRKLFERIK